MASNDTVTDESCVTRTVRGVVSVGTCVGGTCAADVRRSQDRHGACACLWRTLTCLHDVGLVSQMTGVLVAAIGAGAVVAFRGPSARALHDRTAQPQPAAASSP